MKVNLGEIRKALAGVATGATVLISELALTGTVQKVVDIIGVVAGAIATYVIPNAASAPTRTLEGALNVSQGTSVTPGT